VVPGEVDAGEEAVEDPDAGGAVAVVPEEKKDAGMQQVAAAPVDAGKVAAVEPKDAGAAVVVAPEPKDAGTKVAAAPADAGEKVAVAPAAADAGSTAPIAAGDFEALLSEAKLQVQKQRWRGAMDAFRKALKLNPGSGEAKTGLGIALVMSETGFKEAVPLLKDGVKEDPQNAQAWLALGLAYQNMGQDKAAKQPYMEYLKLKPKGTTSDEIRMALEQMR
jgi:Flp pilus assembly protein TadD